MSTQDCIENALAAGDLVELMPSLPGSSCMRRVLVSCHVYNFLNCAPSTPLEVIPKIADTRYALDRFITGASISVNMTPYDHEKPSSTELSRLDIERSIWQFRIRDPKPQIRILGMFAERDTFVALDYANRDTMYYPASESITQSQWDDLFQGIPPVTGEKIDAYISDKYRPVKPEK